jgi:excinuclease UvrABC nuclease subunit
MRHFGGLAAIRAATAEELAAVDGIGQKLAAIIWGSLHAEE